MRKQVRRCKNRPGGKEDLVTPPAEMTTAAAQSTPLSTRPRPILTTKMTTTTEGSFNHLLKDNYRESFNYSRKRFRSESDTFWKI